MSKVVLAYSGGMDSTVLLHLASKQFDEVYVVMFDYGQRHKKELISARYQIASISNLAQWSTIQLPFIGNYTSSALTNTVIDVPVTSQVMGDPQTAAYIPNRNMTFLSILIGIAEDKNIGNVWYGAAQADSVAGFYDGSQEFLDAINNITSLNRRHKITVEAPLLDKSKKQIIELGLELGVDYSNTWTCYNGEEKACGECTACALRLKGFVDVGIPDPVNYSKDIPWDKLIKSAAK